MVSIVVREPRTLEGESVNVPEPKAAEVVVKVRRAGICGSDVHILHGSNPFAGYPRVIGHEFAGQVFSLGAGVRSAPSTLSQQDVVSKELTIVGSRLNRRLIPQVVTWLAEERLKPESMITQVFAAAEAREAFDLIEKDPQRTLKVQLDFS